MAYLINGLVYVPLQVETPTEKNDVQIQTDAGLDVQTQTDGLRNPIELSESLTSVVRLVHQQYPSLQCRVLKWGAYDEYKALEISRIKADIPPEKGGPLVLASVKIHEDLTCKGTVAGEEIEVPEIRKSANERVDLKSVKNLLQVLSDQHVFCAGILKKEFETVCCAIRYKPKALVLKHYPFKRYTARKCLKWFELRKNAGKEERAAVLSGDARCSACSKVYREVRQRNKAQLPKHNRVERQKRTSATSNYPWSLLSPRGQKRKRENILKERKRQKKMIHNLAQKLRETSEVELDEEQSKELSHFVSLVNKQQLDEALQNENPDTSCALKEAFHHDQQRNGPGCRSNKLSMATYRVGKSLFYTVNVLNFAVNFFFILKNGLRSQCA